MSESLGDIPGRGMAPTPAGDEVLVRELHPRQTAKFCPIRDSVSEASEILEFEEALPGHTLGNGIIEPK